MYLQAKDLSAARGALAIVHKSFRSKIARALGPNQLYAPMFSSS